MFHVVNADGVLQESEKAKLRSVLSEAYSVTGVALDALVAAGEEADREAIDLYAFTRVLKRHLDADARIEFIGLLWAMAYADGRADELEDNTVWRVAELIGVDSRDRIAARQRIKASIAGADRRPGRQRVALHGVWQPAENPGRVAPGNVEPRTRRPSAAWNPAMSWISGGRRSATRCRIRWPTMPARSFSAAR